MLNYLHGIIDIPLKLQAYLMTMVKWWTNVSFAVHPDMRIHMGGYCFFGKGVVYCTLLKQKIDTKSPTKSDMAGIDNVMPHTLWTWYLI